MACEVIGEGATSPTRRDCANGEDGGDGFGIEGALFFGWDGEGDLAAQESVRKGRGGDGFAKAGLSFVASIFLVKVGDIFGALLFKGAKAGGLLEAVCACEVAA